MSNVENKKFYCRICNKELLSVSDKKDLMCSYDNMYIPCYSRFMDFIEHLFYTNYDVPNKETTILRHDIIKYFYTKNKLINFQHFQIQMFMDTFIEIRGEQRIINPDIKVEFIRQKSKP